VQFEGQLGAEDSAINVDIIYPCTEKHISKYSAQQTLMLTETPDVYNAVTLPYILSIPKSAIQWVYNVLDKSKEAERLLFEDPDDDIGFILQPDMKWDQSQVYMHASLCLEVCCVNGRDWWLCRPRAIVS
jgi:m7GpppX diphosphatase